jgi:hypothetical protein
MQKTAPSEIMAISANGTLLQIGRKVSFTDEQGITRIARIMWIYDNKDIALNHFYGNFNLFTRIPADTVFSIPQINC